MTITGPDGSYSFSKLAGGTYTIQETLPQDYLPGLETAGTVAGTASGTAGAAGSGMISGIVLGTDQAGAEYNFGHRGMLLQYISKSLFLASTASGSTIARSFDPAPVISLDGSAGSDYSVTLPDGSDAVSVVNPSTATVTKAGGGWLGSLIVEIGNVQDSSAETLSADTSVLGRRSGDHLQLRQRRAHALRRGLARRLPGRVAATVPCNDTGGRAPTPAPCGSSISSPPTTSTKAIRPRQPSPSPRSSSSTGTTSTTTLTATPNPSTYGESVTFTATITGSSSATTHGPAA